MEKPIRNRRRRKKKTLNAKQLVVLAGCVVGVATLIIAACFLFGGNAPEQPQETTPQRVSMPELTMGEVKRRDTMMVVSNSYLDVEFPYMFSDYIYARAINEPNATALDFRVGTSTMDEALFTIWFNGTEENWSQRSGIVKTDRIGSFDPGDGQPAAAVTVVFYGIPEGLSEDDRGTFKATQESVNEVIASMHQSPKFTP